MEMEGSKGLGSHGSTSGSGGGTRKRRLPPPPSTADDGDAKRPRVGLEGEEEEDLAFLLRLKQEDAEEEAATAPGGRRGAQVRAVMRRLQSGYDTGDDTGDDDEEGEDEGDGDRQQRAPRDRAEEGDERPQDIFTALELLDFETTHALLAADPELISLRQPDELALPLAVAVAARFDRGIKLLLSQQEPPCPLYLVDGRGYSALHLAIESHSELPFLARFLLQYRGVEIDCLAPRPPIADGATPLHCVAPGDDRALRLLLASGADPSLVDAVGQTALDVVGLRWPAGKAKKRARGLLTRRSPFQNYVLHKLRFVARVAGQQQQQPQQRQQQQQAAAQQEPEASSTSANAFVAALVRTATEKLLDLRLEAQSTDQLVGVGEEGFGAAQDADDRILCRLETTGVYSFVNGSGHLCLARLDRSTSPLLLASEPEAPPGASAAEASASAPGPPPLPPRPRPPLPPRPPPPASSSSSSSSPLSSAPTSAATSPLTSPLAMSSIPHPLTRDSSTGGPAAAVDAAAAPPMSPTCCPLSRLKAARAVIFDVGEADEETRRARANLLLGHGQGQGQKEGQGQGEEDDEAGREPWVLLPSLPRVRLRSPEGGPEALAAAVLEHVVLGLTDEAVFDALQAMLWR